MIQKWDFYEVILSGPQEGNPFTDVRLTARFSGAGESYTITGFYDGGGAYKIKFMPESEGEWHYETTSNHGDLDGLKGSFICGPNSEDNHGPVAVANTYHFAHADGAPFKPFGTTLYLWHHQKEELQEQTLKTLSAAPFNKLRMAIFTWDFTNAANPDLSVFQRKSDGLLDFERFNLRYWQNLEKRLLQLIDLGIEADLIVIHPNLPREVEEFYIDYLTARLAQFRNVWWTLANEFNLDKNKTLEDWDRHGMMLARKDPYHRLLTNHNHPAMEFDWSRDYITHVAAQYADQVFVSSLKKKYGKPVINEEAEYEGNHFCHWGNISAHEMVHRFWQGAVLGIYTTHGETFEPDGWSGIGGAYQGESPPRIAFLREIMEEGPSEGIDNLKPGEFWNNLAAGNIDNYLLLYWGCHQPGVWYFDFPEEQGSYMIELIDPWNMTIVELGREYHGKVTINLPCKPNMAARVRKIR